jgi:hypothetical protein
MALFSSSKTNPSANVVDGKLVISLPGAETPAVWQMNLAEAKAASFEIQDGKLPDTYALAMKGPGNAAAPIAMFRKKNDALKALMTIAKALHTAHGKIDPQNAASGTKNTYKEPAPLWKKILFILGGLALLFVIFSFYLAFTMDPSDFETYRQQSGAATSGVPMSADDFLLGQ